MTTRRLALQNHPCTYVVQGMEPQRGQCTFEWLADEPYAITMEFDNSDGTQSIWTISRDLFVDCIIGKPYGLTFGEGDVRLQRGEVTLTVALSPPEAYEAEVTFPIQHIIEFISQTLYVVPRGEQEFQLPEGAAEEWLASITKDQA